MLAYIIKSGLCLIVLFSFYKLFLEAERFHRIKRFYLLFSLLISIVLPLITFSYTVEIPATNPSDGVLITSLSSKNSITEIPWWEEQFPQLLFLGYIIGFSVFSLRFYTNLKKLIIEVKRNDKLKDRPYIYVLLNSKLTPYSFFQYIFLNKQKFKNKEISSAVLDHEKAHVDQKH